MELFIVTPTYNRIARLKQAFTSVQAQTYTDFKWLVINDGSDVPLTEFDFLYEDKRVSLVHMSHAGVSAARKESFSLIRNPGAFIIELDDNDTLAPQAVEHIVGAFNKGADVVYGDHEVIDVDGRVRATVFKPEYHKGLFRDGNFACGIRAYKLAAAKAAGGWRANEWPAGDYSLFLRMENRGASFVCIKKKLGQVRVEPHSIGVTYWPEQIEASRKYREMAIAGIL